MGIDMSLPSSASCAGSRYSHFATAGAGELPFVDNSFDKVIFADVIEHVPDDSLALSEIVRVAKAGAVIVISTPALEGVFTETWLKTFLHGRKTNSKGITVKDIPLLHFVS